MLKKIGLAVLLLSVAGVASAGGPRGKSCKWEDVKYTIGKFSIELPTWECDKSPYPVSAPEFDPASSIAGLTLVAGALAVMRGRRRKNSIA